MNKEKVSFNIDETTNGHSNFQVNAIADVVDEVVESIGKLAYSNSESLAKLLQNYGEIDIDNYEGAVAALMVAGSHSRDLAKLDIHLNNCKIQLAKTSIDAPSKIQLKELPSHLKYGFLGKGNTLAVIVAAKLQEG